MKLWIIMAQLLSLTSFFALILINYHLWRTANSSLSDEYVQEDTTYDELYQSGMQSYTNEDWMGTVFYFERALQEFHYYRSSLTECRLKCQNLSLIATSENDPLSELKVFEGVFKKADCTRRCKLRKLGGRSERIDDSVTDKFLSMTPYSYLQFAYYKNGMYEKAILAAYTYLQWHSDDEVMQNNLDYYRNMHGIDDTKLINLEERVQQKHFLDAYQAHQDESWSKVISEMELALVEYWKADAQCRALCEGKYDNREFMDLYEAIANHYASTLYCKEQCEGWLARINGKQVEDYLPSHFHFLQFAYYKVGDIQNAVKNALSYLLFHPADEVMLQNMAFYENMDDLQMEFVPRREAEDYHERAVLEDRMLNFAKRNFWNENAEEYLYPDRDYDEEDESELAYLGAEPIDPMEVNLKQNEGGDTTGDLGLLSDVEEVEDKEMLRRFLEKQRHENERGAAKYSRDLNHGSQTATPTGAPHPEDTTGSEGRRMGSSTRAQILTGMKKILQSLMGSSEEESEQLLLQLAQDPKSREIKDRIKVAIEKMMANGNVEKDLAREQLKTMIQGLSQQGLIYDHKKETEEKSRDVENFDPASIHRDRKDVVYPSNKPAKMLDIKDYNPMKGLDKKEYFDWVNPPGYEAGAPGSTPTDDSEDEEEDEDEDVGDYITDEEEDDFERNREYYPSEDEGSKHKERTNHESPQQEIENEESEDSNNKSDKSIDKGRIRESLDASNAGETHINDHSQDNLATDITSEEKEVGEKGEEEEEVEEEGEKDDVEDTQLSEDHLDTRRNPYADFIQERMEAQMCSLEELDEDGSCGYHDDDEDEEEKRLSSEEAKLQRILDGEGMTDEVQEWMEEMMKIEDNAYFLLDDLPDLDIVMTDEELNGTNRVVADGLAADQECGVLLQLLDGEAKTGSGYKGKPSPHTKHESFEGLTVNEAVEAASEGRIPLLYPTIYMHLAERSRQFLQRHFQLKSHLFFSFTHLVCRQSRPGSKLAYSDWTRRDLSHPVHADNCNLDPAGNCHKKLPAFVWRDWSAILYLNEDFEGGEFIFAHFNQTAQSVVTPHCGRLVGFSAGSENLHGVKGVIRGRRCALAMWFTLDPRFRELEFFKAADKLNTLYEEQYTREGYYGNQ
ncbi:prolyl 3-hydroxylase 1-like [Diadema antillarum]|uniref:prolyl 3-hydroxylase 1-like n=1 Tax=Diadema antillarum TaxID=105358 RepID=UPI003A859EDE